MTYHYVYYSFEEWGRGYIGSRSSVLLPELDVKYFGSYTDPTFSPTDKIILATFPSREEALDAEMKLHEFFDVDKNPHFANISRLTSKKFILCPTQSMRAKLSKKAKERGVETPPPDA